MATTETVTRKAEGQPSGLNKQLEALRDAFADAPQMGKTALENVIRNAKPTPATSSAESAGRAGRRRGKVSELTVIAPVAQGGAKRLHGVLDALGGNFPGADRVGTLHNMRFVFLDNDTRVLFATAYDGEWDAYINDFATKIPDQMDLLFSSIEGWPGIRSPLVKDFIAKYQVTADAWYVANPNLTVVEAQRLERVGKALDEFLDKVSG
jgi:hypothetical protein